MSELPAPPRNLSKNTRQRLYLGRPLLLFSLIAASLVSLGMVFLMATYGLEVSDLFAPTQTVTAESKLSKLESEFLAGERVPVAIAPVEVNGVLLEVRGYGPKVSQSKVGDAVTIVIPKSAPHRAGLQGFWRKPARLKTLLGISIFFYLPLLVLLAGSLKRSRSTSRLLTEGEICQGRQIKTINLPRPLADHQLVRWEAEGKKFWTLSLKELEDPTLLKLGSERALLESHLPEWELKSGTIFDLSPWSKLFTGTSKFFISLNGALIILFFLV